MKPTSQPGRWLMLLLLVATAFAVVAVPVVLIRPFSPQTPDSIALAFALRRWSPWITLGAAFIGLGLAVPLWRAAPRFLPRAGLVLLGLVTLVTTWAARQNHFEWMFAPLPDARFIRAAQATEVKPADMVLAVQIAGDAAAYPVRQLAYHHLVEDAVGGVPIVATY